MDVLPSEYSEEFDIMRKNRSKMSFYKYGSAAINFGEGLESALGCIDLCIKKYKETGNTEYLLDVGNYAMFEFMYPQHEKPFFRATSSEESAGISGTCIKDLEKEADK